MELTNISKELTFQENFKSSVSNNFYDIPPYY